jgi:hypothetical protein
VSHKNYTLSPQNVRNLAEESLKDHIILKTQGKKVTIPVLAHILILVAVMRSSLSGVVKRYDFGFSHETARTALHANLESIEEVTDRIVKALHEYLPAKLRRRRRGWIVAMDTHYCPYYGDITNPKIVGGKKKQGTNYFYNYATAVIVHEGFRYTIGLVPLTESQPSCAIVAALLAQIDRLGLKIRGVVLDCGFDSGDTLLLLQERKFWYTIPLRRCGGTKNRRNAYWDLPVGTITEISWTTEKSRREVTTEAVVLQRKGEIQKRLYAFGGWTWSRASQALSRMRTARKWYRRRFGIETSYRQMNQGKGRTTSNDASYRLLLLGLALLIRQIWVWLTSCLAVGGDRRRSIAQEFTLDLMIDWLRIATRRRLQERCSFRPIKPISPKKSGKS